MDMTAREATEVCIIRSTKPIGN